MSTKTVQSRHVKNYIGGRWTESAVVSESRNPASGKPLGTYADGGAEEARAAIDAAREAFKNSEWSRNRELRAQALFEIADGMSARREELIKVISAEHGKVLPEAALEVDLTISKLRYNAALALTDSGRAAEVKPGLYSMTLRQAAGVAGVIAPFNWPLILAVRSFAPALAAGCTVVLKLPGRTALTNGLFYEIVGSAASLPEGVFNAFTESGDEGAKLLVADPGVNVISFTGSTKVGKSIMAGAAPHVKAMSLELGGKNPMVVFDDADLDIVVPGLIAAITMTTGQICFTGSRILVQRGIADELRTRLAASLEEVRVGPGDDPESAMGPLIDVATAARVHQVVEEATAYAKVVVRGGRITEGPLAAGAFVRPSLVEVDDVSKPIVQEEIFGPVATFEVFDDEADAIARANATNFGLAASVWTQDVDRPLRVGRELDAGTVWTNTWGIILDQMDEGGFKNSGAGRLNGPQALENFQEIKHFVHVAPRH